jgi:hypothetical protein
MPVKRASGLADLIAGGGLMGKQEAAQPSAAPSSAATAFPAARATRPLTAVGRGGAENRAPDNTGRQTTRARSQSARVCPRKEPAAAVDDAGVQRPERLGEMASAGCAIELSDRPEGGVRDGGGLGRRGSKPVERTPVVAPISAKAWSSEVRVNSLRQRFGRGCRRSVEVLSHISSPNPMLYAAGEVWWLQGCNRGGWASTEVGVGRHAQDYWTGDAPDGDVASAAPDPPADTAAVASSVVEDGVVVFPEDIKSDRGRARWLESQLLTERQATADIARVRGSFDGYIHCCPGPGAHGSEARASP